MSGGRDARLQRRPERSSDTVPRLSNFTIDSLIAADGNSTPPPGCHRRTLPVVRPPVAAAAAAAVASTSHDGCLLGAPEAAATPPPTPPRGLRQLPSVVPVAWSSQFSLAAVMRGLLPPPPPPHRLNGSTGETVQFTTQDAHLKVASSVSYEEFSRRT